MENILKYLLQLAKLDKETLNKVLLMGACLFLYYQWMGAAGQVSGKEIEIKKLNEQAYQSQVEERNREREYTREKNEAVLKALEDCELQKINIYKKLTPNVSKSK